MTYDAVIIGAGPGGYEAALWVSRLGGKALVIEKGKLGGVCTNRGCIPTKALVASSQAYGTLRRAKEYGLKAESVSADHEAILRRRDRVSTIMRKGVEKLLNDAGVEVVSGVARIRSKTEVEAEGRVIECKNIVVATGSEPIGFPGCELDGEYVVSGDDAAELSRIPEKVVVVGGGFIGCEYASIYGRLGSQVTLVEELPRILPAEDEDVSAELERQLSKDVTVVTATRVDGVDKKNRSVSVAGQEIGCDMVLVAVGRKAVIPEGLREAGVECDESGIKVNTRMQTNIDGVYAVGDVTGGYMLAHTAYAQAEAAAANIMGQDVEADLSSVPWCVFTVPEVARVGVTEKEAEGGVTVGRSDYAANGKAVCMGERNGFCKVVAGGDGVLMGVHVIGVHASDIIGEAAVAVAKKRTLKQIAQTIHPHPTLSELIRDACRDAL